MHLIIAIDGPAGSGKTTTAKESAKRLGIVYLDTGAMYRAAAYYVLSKKTDVENEEEVKRLLPEIEISFENRGSERRILLNGNDVSELIRTEEISQAASKMSTLKSVRDFLVSQQRKIGESSDLVAEGRDIGTVVFPNATLKFFMQCSVDERARRRAKEYEDKNIKVSYEDIRNQIEERDLRDSSRAHAPLKMAEDAVLIDTTNMSKEEQIQLVVRKAKETQGIL